MPPQRQPGGETPPKKKLVAKEVGRKAAEEKPEAVVEAHQNEARQVADEKGRAEAAPETAEAQARAAGQDATKPQAPGDARLKAEEATRKVLKPRQSRVWKSKSTSRGPKPT